MWQQSGRGGRGRGGGGGYGKGRGYSKGGGSYRYDQDWPDGTRGGSRGGGKGGGGKGGGGKGGGGKGGSGKGGGGKSGGNKWHDRPIDSRTPSEKNADVDQIDAIFGYHKLDKTSEAGKEHVGWMTNMRQLVVEDEEGGQRAACEYYFLAPDGTGFKVGEVNTAYWHQTAADANMSSSRRLALLVCGTQLLGPLPRCVMASLSHAS